MVNKDSRKKINIGSNNLGKNKHEKLLGVNANSNLNFEAHIGDLCKKSSSFFCKCKAMNLLRKGADGFATSVKLVACYFIHIAVPLWLFPDKFTKL